jgi:hypothetical protein
MRERGQAMGSEFVGKGVNIILGPAMNMARLAQGITAAFYHPRRTHSYDRQVVGSGKALAATHSWLVKLPTRPFSDCNNLGYKPVPSTGLTMNRNMAGNRPRPKSMTGPNTKSTLTHSYDPSWPESPPSCVVTVSGLRSPA